MKKSFLSFLFSFIFFLGLAEDGAVLYQIKGCHACHGAGASGNQVIGAAQLAGQSKAYLEYQLKQFKAGNRGYSAEDQKGKVMLPIVKYLKDEEIEALADYLSKLPLKPQTVPTLFGVPALGKDTYALCAACHGEQAQGVDELSAPSLRGLQDWYIKHQISKFKNGVRGVDAEKEIFGAGMAAISMAIPEGEDLNNLIAYIRFLSLQPIEPTEEADAKNE